MSDPVRLATIDREYAALGGAVEAAVKKVFASGAFILGPEVQALEKALAGYLGVKHVVTCANGTDALVIGLRALGVGEGDEVIVPSFTFAASVEAIVLAGATPVFADIDPDTLLLDPEDAARRHTPRTKAVMPVHLFGLCVDVARLRSAFGGREILVVEDAAQAIGADDGAGKAGALGDIAGFSFYPTKNLGGPGDGGMVTTGSDRAADMARLIRAHGSSKAYLHDVLGTNSRLDEIQAAVLRLKLPHLDEWNGKRREHAARYRQAARDSGLRLPVEPDRGSHVYHHFTVRTADRDRFLAHLKAAGIGFGIYYHVPNHRQPAFARWAQGVSLPNAERAADEVVSLPVHQWLTDEELGRVEACLRGWKER